MKTPRRDLWLMLLPVLILGSIGLALRHRQGAVLTLSGDQFALTHLGARSVPLSPREVYEGYDTKIAVDLGHRGNVPAWWGKPDDLWGTTQGKWRLDVVSDGKSKPVRGPDGKPLTFMRWSPAYDKMHDRYTANYLMKLRDVRAGGEIRLHDHVSVFGATMQNPLCAPVAVDAAVRGKNIPTAMPTVSHDPGFRLERAEVDIAAPILTSNRVAHAFVRFVLYRTGPGSEQNSAQGEFEVRDAHGRTWSPFEASGRGSEVEIGGTNRRATITENIGVIPRSAGLTGPLRLVGRIWSEDRWPQTVDVPIQDAQGRILTTPRAAPVFRIKSVRAAAATLDEVKETGASTTVIATLVLSKEVVKNAGHPLWEVDYSQHVVDSKGKQYWRFPLQNRWLPAQSSFSYGDPGPANEIQVLYHFNLKNIPKSAGRLTFHAEISADGSRRVPVSVVVRP